MFEHTARIEIAVLVTTPQQNDIHPVSICFTNYVKPDATHKTFIGVLYLNMFRASICSSSGEQCIELPHMMRSTEKRDKNREVWCCSDVC
jgi:hypothetical protein